MARVNLKQVKDALNSLPDEHLDKFFIMHTMCLEDGEVKLGVVFFDDEEERGKHMKLYEEEGMKVLKEFTEAIEQDCKKIAICLIDEEKAEDYAEDCE